MQHAGGVRGPAQALAGWLLQRPSAFASSCCIIMEHPPAGFEVRPTSVHAASNAPWCVEKGAPAACAFAGRLAWEPQDTRQAVMIQAPAWRASARACHSMCDPKAPSRAAVRCSAVHAVQQRDATSAPTELYAAVRGHERPARPAGAAPRSQFHLIRCGVGWGGGVQQRAWSTHRVLRVRCLHACASVGCGSGSIGQARPGRACARPHRSRPRRSDGCEHTHACHTMSCHVMS